MISYSEKLAEFIGIMLGDGSICSYPDKSSYTIYVCGNATTDKDYLIKHVKNLAEQVLNINFKIKHHSNPEQDGLYLYVYGKKYVELFNNLGLPSGNKMKNNICIPNWIFKNKKFVRACIRGFFDTDGSIYRHWNSDRYFIEFTTNSLELQKTITKALNMLDYTSSRWFRAKGSSWRCGIYKKDEVRKFLKDVGTHNSKHRRRCPNCLVVQDIGQGR